MRSRASDAAIATSRSQSENCRKIRAPSELACPSIRLMPVMVEIASSTGRSTVRSTSSGVEPGYGRNTMRKGGETSGNAYRGNRIAAISPITNSDTNSITVVTGRLMLSSATLTSARSFGQAIGIVKRILVMGHVLGDFLCLAPRAAAALAVVRVCTPVEQVVHHRNHHQGQQGRNQQAADHRDRHR